MWTANGYVGDMCRNYEELAGMDNSAADTQHFLGPFPVKLKRVYQLKAQVSPTFAGGSSKLFLTTSLRKADSVW